MRLTIHLTDVCGHLRRLLQGHVNLDPELSKADTHVYRSMQAACTRLSLGNKGGGTRVSGALALRNQILGLEATSVDSQKSGPYDARLSRGTIVSYMIDCIKSSMR